MAEADSSALNQLADLDDNGKPLDSRVSTASQAQGICDRFIRDDTARAARRLTVQGAFNGNAPKSSAAMLAAKRGGDSNLNWRDLRGQIVNAHTPFFDLVCELPCCIDADLDVGDDQQNVDLMRGIAEYFHKMVFGWRGFDDMNQLSDLQMILHGVGPIAWMDEWIWFPEPILSNNFYVPDETLANMDNAEMAMLTQPINAGQLWRKIEDPVAARAMGWKPDVVRATIMDSGNSDANQAYGKIWDRWEQAFKNGDLYISQTQTKQIKLNTLFVQEMDGTISQMIVPQRAGSSATMPPDGGFLYFKRGKYANWDQVICLFPYDIGADGTFHSVKGLGTDAFPYTELLNKIKNTIADTLVVGIKPMWQPATGGDIEKFQMVKWGGGNMVPMGFNPVDMNIGKSLQPALEVSREFSSALAQNTGAYTQSDLSQPTVEETAKSTMIRAAERSKLTKGAANRYMRAKSRQYAEMFRRASNPLLRPHHPQSEAPLKFQRQCRRLCNKMGIPWEVTFTDAQKDDSPTGEPGTFTVLQMVQNVRANMSLGMGSAAMRIEIANQLMANIDRFDEIGQNEILRMWTSVMTNYQIVDAIVPSLSEGRENVNDQSIAAGEDNGFADRGPDAEAFVVPGQNHVIHLSVHVPSMQMVMQGCQQGAVDPRKCAMQLEGQAPHAMKHLQALKTNPTRQKEYEQFSQAMQEIASFQDHLQQMIEEQNQAQAQQPQPGQPDPEMIKAQGSIQIKQEKEQAAAALKQQKQQFDQELAAQQQDFNQKLAAQKLAMEQELKAQDAQFNRRITDLETAANVRRDNVVAQHDVNRKNAAVVAAPATNGANNP